MDPCPSRLEPPRDSSPLVDPCSSHQEAACQETRVRSSRVQTGLEPARARGTPGLEELEPARLESGSSPLGSCTTLGGRALCQGGGDLISGESGAVCEGAEDGGAGTRRLRRKEVVEQSIVGLGWGGGIREGEEARGKSSQGQLFYGPYIPGGG